MHRAALRGRPSQCSRRRGRLVLALLQHFLPALLRLLLSVLAAVVAWRQARCSRAQAWQHWPLQYQPLKRARRARTRQQLQEQEQEQVEGGLALALLQGEAAHHQLPQQQARGEQLRQEHWLPQVQLGHGRAAPPPRFHLRPRHCALRPDLPAQEQVLVPVHHQSCWRRPSARFFRLASSPSSCRPASRHSRRCQQSWPQQLLPLLLQLSPMLQQLPAGLSAVRVLQPVLAVGLLLLLLRLALKALARPLHLHLHRCLV